ncbi:MAG TPA: DedA family protein [Nitrospira sp.]|nr:DedA family protein [Nitrospira sp.]
METTLAWIHNYEYPAIVLLLMLGIVGLPIPDETLLLFVGYLSFKGELSTPLSLSAAVLGSACGITISYGLGHLLGARVPTTLGPWLHIDQTRFLTAQRWVSRWGKYGLLVAYFVPGLRHLGALTLGAAGLQYPTFAIFAYTGAVVWSTTFITAGYLLGEQWAASSTTLHQTFQWIGIGTMVTVVGLIMVILLRRSSSRS